MKTRYKFTFGFKAKRTWFGGWSSSRGMYSGGFDRNVYGITWLFNIETVKGWGYFNDIKFLGE